MKKKLKIFGVGICCIVVLMINIFANINVNPSKTDLSSLVSTAMADGELDCTDRCDFNSLDVCYVAYPYGCLGTKLIKT